jgi:beta-glucosidase
LDSLKWNAAVEASVNNSDVIVVCLGEKPSTEKPGDIDDLKLDEAQREFVKRLYTLNKPVVLVLVENRPRIIEDIADKAAAVVMAYQPGDFGGEAIANILYGVTQPSGRLPFTYPRFNQSLLTYDHKYTETIDQQFGNNAFQPQWPFGHGLTYQPITYREMRIANEQWKGSGEWKISVVVKNEGNVAVNESVLLFMRDMYASITPKVKALKRFEKINIPAQSEVIVEFTISDKDLEFCTDKGKWIKEAGAFEWQCGTLKKEIVWQP